MGRAGLGGCAAAACPRPHLRHGAAVLARGQTWSAPVPGSRGRARRSLASPAMCTRASRAPSPPPSAAMVPAPSDVFDRARLPRQWPWLVLLPDGLHGTLAAMSTPAPKPSPYEQLLELPENVIGEILDGQLYVQPRPATLHSQAASVLGEELGPPFKRGDGGPGGWIILDEPELRVGPRPDVLVPDLAGWRREHMPELPDAPHITLAPDWVCEVLSPSTRKLDRTKKLAIYRRERVAHVWIIDPLDRTLEIFRLIGDLYALAAAFSEEDERVRAEPFDAIALHLAALWQR
jgi:Uma2 family endonuclease